MNNRMGQNINCLHLYPWRKWRVYHPITITKNWFSVNDMTNNVLLLPIWEYEHTLYVRIPNLLFHVSRWFCRKVFTKPKNCSITYKFTIQQGSLQKKFKAKVLSVCSSQGPKTKREFFYSQELNAKPLRSKQIFV